MSISTGTEAQNRQKTWCEAAASREARRATGHPAPAAGGPRENNGDVTVTGGSSAGGGAERTPLECAPRRSSSRGGGMLGARSSHQSIAIGSIADRLSLSSRRLRVSAEEAEEVLIHTSID